MPSLLNGITFAIDVLVVPLTMVWFVVRWFRLVRNDGKHAKALKATRQGYSAGVALAALLVLGFHYCDPEPGEGKLSVLGVGSALVIGLLAGVLPSLTKNLAAEGPDESESWKYFPVVAAASALGLAALVLYFAYSGKYLIHQWLMFAFVTLLCISRLSLVFGD